MRKKTNLKLRELIIKLKKSGNLEIANILALPRKKAVKVNLEKLEKETEANDTVIVPGKVLGSGDIFHSITIAAFSFSQQARKKLLETKCKIVSMEKIAGKAKLVI